MMRTHGGAREGSGGAGFTLIELVVSLSITAVLMTAMMSAVVVASSALPDADDPAAELIEAAGVLQTMTDEIASAREITRQSARSIVLVLDDRDGDGEPEVVRYRWSGVAGETLQRGTARGSQRELLAVDGFALSYHTATETTTLDAKSVATGSAEVSDNSGGVNPSGHDLTDLLWIAQTIDPPTVDGLTSWRVTSVRVWLERAGTEDGAVTVAVYEADDTGLPEDDVPLQTAVVRSSALSSGGGRWQTISFTTPAEVDAGQRLAVVYSAEVVKGAVQARVYSAQPLLAASGGMHGTDDGGDSWQAVAGVTVRHTVRTSYEAASDSNTVVEHQRVHRVSISLTPSGGEAIAADAIALNAPQAVSALWWTDFAADPTALDLDLNGTADWIMVSGPAIDAGTLSKGWELDGTLGTNAAAELAQPLLVETELSDCTDGGTGGGLEMFVENTGGRQGRVRVGANRDSGELVLTVWVSSADGSLEAAHEEGLDDDAVVGVGLLIEPTSNAVGVWIDGVSRGAFVYETFAGAAPGRVQTWEESGGSGVKIGATRAALGGTVR